VTAIELSKDDHDRVNRAISEAEAGTAGEIVAVTAPVSDSYHDVGLHYALGVLFLVLASVAIWPGLLDFWWRQLIGWSAPPTMRELMTLLLGICLAKFLAVLFIMKWMPLRLALTPGPTRTRRVRRRAIILFKAAAEHRTEGRTGVLIYLSMGEHRAEIVGDEAITAVTSPDTWGEAMAALIAEVKADKPADGIVAAVGLIGAVLATHFPRASGDKNEIPDKLIEL
jgi:putative membrane protein